MTARIPQDTWLEYRTKLLKMIAKPKMANATFCTRRGMIARILFLSEELEGMAVCDWDRIENAAMLSVVLAVGTNDPDEAHDVDEEGEWLRERLRTCRWIRGMLGVKDRVAQVQTEKLEFTLTA